MSRIDTLWDRMHIIEVTTADTPDVTIEENHTMEACIDVQPVCRLHKHPLPPTRLHKRILTSIKSDTLFTTAHRYGIAAVNYPDPQ